MEQIIRKSLLVAKTELDYKKIFYEKEHFIVGKYQEEREEIIVSYETEGKISLKEIRKENQKDILAVLLEVALLRKNAEEYNFSIDSNNLFYDRNNRVYVLDRDVYERGVSMNEEKFISEYKALIGYALQKKYSFLDYMEGGEDLVKKNRILAPLYGINTIEEIHKYLEILYENQINDFMENKVQVNKKNFKNSRIYMLLATIAIIFLTGYFVNNQFIIIPRTEAMLAASGAYLQTDYIKVIDYLKPVDLEYLEKYQKYILATAYIKSENLNMEQKENILEEITLNADEKIMNYWIYIGRLEVLEAQNIALQNSDDELLLYAYLKEKALVEGDVNISGEEKSKQLDELESKIEKIAKKFETTEA